MVSKPFKMYTIEESRKGKGKYSVRCGTQGSLKCQEDTVFYLQGSTTEATLKCFIFTTLRKLGIDTLQWPTLPISRGVQTSNQIVS